MSNDSGQWVEAGALVRGQLRRELTKAGIRFEETKTLLSSVFIIREDRNTYLRVCRALTS